ncbi:acyltransferase family protein [Clostridium sp. MCC353]|uniref:acyltransferase family protein n=1 Tax=Clostridium sp. MCC353 TaxID=2592646 RepID=UPI001C02C165|nr:acyltransferase [Clostridium sp. MCC353]MBT9777212.1 acyltransferase family protein [Clostridium sp. MCC353]
MKFDKTQTNICKGIAIILMIIHHIFPNMEGYGLNVFGIWIMPQLAILGKICVSIFLFLSGYGLFESYKKRSFEIKKFYVKRLKTIYINYWMVFIIFTSIGWFFYRNIFLSFLQYPFSPLKNLIINFLGIQYFYNGYMGYNPSWWFVSEILLLYLLFPLMKKMLENKKGTIILVIFALLFYSLFNKIQINDFYVNLLYFCPFIIGAFFSKYEIFNICYKHLSIKKSNIVCFVIVTCIISFFRIKVGLNGWGIRIDCILAPLYCLIENYLYDNKNDDKWYNMLAFLGKHSFNIYLIHLFITNMYTTPYIYNLNSPFFMVTVTIMISLFFSYFIETIKIILKIG